jgi:UDP-glucose 4-epimerase
VPCSPYAAAKWAANGYARMFHALYDTPVVVARLFMVYGPGQRDLRKLIPYVTLSLLRGEPPKLSSGRRPVDWIYVNDVVIGLLNLGNAPGVDGAVVDLGFGELVTTREVVEILRDIIGGPQPEFGALPERPMERVKTADVDATYRMIGWKPAVSLREGLKKTVEWYQSQLKTGNG